jgi:hypothetical protein
MAEGGSLSKRSEGTASARGAQGGDEKPKDNSK